MVNRQNNALYLFGLLVVIIYNSVLKRWVKEKLNRFTLKCSQNINILAFYMGMLLYVYGYVIIE